jgi:hypothetical protein
MIKVSTPTRVISIKMYLNGWRNAKKHPRDEFKHSLRGFMPATGEEIRKQYLEMLHERINERGMA